MSWKRSIARPTTLWLELLSSRRSRLSGAGVTLVIFAGMAVALNFPGYRPSDFLLRDLERQVAGMPVTELLPHLRRMSELGDSGIAAVARLLTEEDEAVVEAAHVILSEQLDQWRRLPRGESAPKAIHLARVLAQLDLPPSPQRRGAISDLAARLLLWPAVNGSQAGELAAHCEHVLAAGRSGRSEAASAPVRQASESPSPGQSRSR